MKISDVFSNTRFSQMKVSQDNNKSRETDLNASGNLKFRGNFDELIKSPLADKLTKVFKNASENKIKSVKAEFGGDLTDMAKTALGNMAKYAGMILSYESENSERFKNLSEEKKYYQSLLNDNEGDKITVTDAKYKLAADDEDSGDKNVAEVDREEIEKALEETQKEINNHLSPSGGANSTVETLKELFRHWAGVFAAITDIEINLDGYDRIQESSVKNGSMSEEDEYLSRSNKTVSFLNKFVKGLNSFKKEYDEKVKNDRRFDDDDENKAAFEQMLAYYKKDALEKSLIEELDEKRKKKSVTEEIQESADEKKDSEEK